MRRRFFLVLCLATCLTSSVGAAEKLPYVDDPEILRQLRALKPGESLLLPPLQHFAAGEPIKAAGRDGPYSRDYTNRMVYAPERQTALYSGGNHGFGRMNDVWELHLGSNAYHRLHEADGGDHARFKFALMFYPAMVKKNPDVQLTEKQQAEVDACKTWWCENVELRDGNFVMRNTGAPLLVGHTWDTLIYDPVNRRLIHGTGAHCANTPWLDHRYRDTPLAEIEAKHGKRADGTPWRRPWTFDPNSGKWSPYANESSLAMMRGMGASLLYLPDQEKAVFYYAGQNTPGAKHVMCLWDLRRDTWEELRPNGGQDVGKLGIFQKLAPESEQQMAYSVPHRKIVAVRKENTFVYDFASNAWSKQNEAVPFFASDAGTIFAYDETADVFLLADPRKNLLAAYDLKSNEWQTLTPTGPGIPKPPHNVGKGYYDPTHNVFVVQAASSNRIWAYRHAVRPTP